MIVSNSIDTLCFTIQLDKETQAYLVGMQFFHEMIPDGIYPTDSGIIKYKFGLIEDGISIYYTDSDEMNPNCYIRFSSEVIQRQGYKDVYYRCIGLLKSFGAKRVKRRLKLSQVDIAFDFQNDFSLYINSSDYRVQTKLSSTSTREESGKVVWKLWGVGGSNGYKVRCYDKLQEAKSVDGKLYWLGVWESQGYDLDRPVWRVEYELRRSFLKCWRINTFDQFLSCQQAIQKRLFELWNIKKITDSNISRCEYVDEYKFLFDNFTQNYRINKIDKRPDEYKRCSKNKYSGALLSLKSYLGNGVAFFESNTGLRVNRECVRNNLLNKFFNEVLDSDFFEKDIFESYVDELLLKRGYYFSPVEVWDGNTKNLYY